MKKIISIVLCLVLAVSVLASCSSDTTGAASQDQSGEAAETASDAASSEAVGEGETSGAPYKIALSNSYMENGWRQEMEVVAELVAASDVYKDKCTLDIYNTDNTAEAQAASIESLIPMGYDAIIIDCASDSGLNNVIDEAVESGVVVVTFDSNCTTDSAYTIAIDSATSYGFVAEYLAAAINHTGNVVVDRGISSTSTSKGIYDAVMAVFDQYPDINICAEIEGEFNEGTTQNAFATVLATQDVDAVLSQAYCTSIENACIDAGVKCVPSNGDGYNCNMLIMVDNDVPGAFVPWYVGMSAIALDTAIKVLDGETVEKNQEIAPDVIVTDDSFVDLDAISESTGANYVVAVEGEQYSKDWPLQFLWPALPEDFPVQLQAQDVIDALNG